MEENQTEITHTATCFDVQDFTHTLVEHFDLLMEHIKKHFDQDFVSNICVSKKFFKKFGFRTDRIDELYWGILWVYNRGTDKHFSHCSTLQRIENHFCNEMILFIKDEKTQKEIKAYFRFWAMDLFKGKRKDVWIYDLR